MNKEQKLALYDELVASHRGVQRKGVTLPYTSLNGHMFSFLDENGVLNLRLPDEARTAFLKRHKTAFTLQHGVVMKDYVALPNDILKDGAALKKYFQLSCAHVRSLKPKKKKPKKKAGRVARRAVRAPRR